MNSNSKEINHRGAEAQRKQEKTQSAACDFGMNQKSDLLKSGDRFLVPVSAFQQLVFPFLPIKSRKNASSECRVQLEHASAVLNDHFIVFPVLIELFF